MERPAMPLQANSLAMREWSAPQKDESSRAKVRAARLETLSTAENR